MRYYTCYEYIDNIMPMAIAKYYIKKNFNDNVKSEVQQMVKNIKEAMINRISKMEWLDEETRDYAKIKVEKMKEKIGYPEDIMIPKKLYQRYENIEINDLFDLTILNNIFSYGKELKILDPNEWISTPYEVNAYYDPISNSILFPAAYLQSPIYSSNEQDYINYGAIGSTIGHELTHAFDNSGRLFDVDGNMRNWWTDNDNEEFLEYSQCFIDEYDSITYPLGGETLKVNGKKTLGENLADNGGLARAYDAWQLSIQKNPEKAVERNMKLPGFENYTTDQLFYIVYGQKRCSNDYSPESDNHSPGIARVNGVVANSEHFAKTFNCPEKSPMNPDNKCVLW